MKNLTCWVFWPLVYQPTRSDLGCIPGLGVGCANGRGEPGQIEVRLYLPSPPSEAPKAARQHIRSLGYGQGSHQPLYKETNPC